MNHIILESGAMNSNNNNSQQDYYIYELPSALRSALCQHLDELDIWPQLAKFTQILPEEVQQIKQLQLRGKSPSNGFLNIWGGTYNHTVLELFIVFYRCKLHQAMRLLKDFVERKHHTLIPNSVPAISQLRPTPPASKATEHKEMNISVSNNITTDNNLSAMNSNKPEHSTNLSESTVLKEAQTLEINYAELTEGTDNWSSSNILGKGGFGIVYKGYWQHTEVAIKVMDYRRASNDTNVKVEIEQSLNELKHLNSHRHPHILALYGYSIKGEKPCLVYQLMKGGSLQQRIIGKKFKPLTWTERFNICRGTAAGISYLHTSHQKALIHGDIKPDNILLDECLQPKIGDFGLARETFNAVVEVTQVFGTKFYLPPEYLKLKKLSKAVDIYSFGVVLLETFTENRAYDTKRSENLPDYIRKLYVNNTADIFDARLPKPTPGHELAMCHTVMTEALKCTSILPIERPEMDLVVKAFDRFKPV